MKTNFRSFIYLGLPVGVAIIFLLALFLALPGTTVVAAPNAEVLIENFDYGSTPGDLTTISGGTWVAHSGAGTGPIQYIATSLSMPGYGSSDVGGSATFGGGSEDVNTTFAAQSSGTVYAAALVNISSATTGNYFLHLMEAGTTNFRARVFAQDSSSNLRFGLSSSSSTAIYATADFSYNTTYLLVIKYDVVTGDSALYVLDAYSATEPVTPLVTSTGTANTISAFAIRQSSGIPNGTIDGVRIATSWEDAVGSSSSGNWIINEIHADPAGDITGDANGDGVRDSSDDEFVEIFNDTGAGVDISGWTISDGFGLRHTFPSDTMIPNGCAVVVFGGGTPTGDFGNCTVQVASTGALGLNNSGDTVTLNNGSTDVISLTYGAEGGNDQSITRDPDVTGSDPLVLHSTATGSGGALFSPGTMIDGTAFSGCPAPPASDLTIGKTGAASVIAGEDLVYEITVSNLNIDPATDVVVTDTLPISTTYVSDDSGVTPTTPSAGEYVWDLGSVISNTQVTFNLTVTVDIAIPSATVLTNTVEVSTTAAGDDPTNNSDEVQTTVVPSPSCGDPATRIHIIQGSGTSSPEDGNVHAIEGVVVGDFQTSDYLRGFFLQEDDANVDADPTTSEGIFVYDGSSPAVDVNKGDVVRVVGTVDEYFGLTQLGSVSSVEVCMTSGVATPAIPTLPVTSVDDWEWYEGMSVNITETLYATDNYNQGRYGEITLSIDSRQYNPTNVVEPGTAANDMQDLNDRSRIQLDDGRTSQNPVPPPYFAADGTLRAGDTLPELTGVLGYAFSAYEIHPTENITFTRVNDREATPPDVGGTHKVASFNVLNYFTTLDDSGAICGPSEDMDCRGADTADEFTRQRTKIITAVLTMDADVIGLMEIENHITDDAVLDLVSGLNAIAGAGTYAAIDTGTIGTDAIKVALLYKPAKVSPVGAYAILDSSVDATFLDTKNRPVLAQTFADVDTGVMFTVAVNHLKSKGSDCDDVSDPDTGDGQGNCNLTRTAAATALVNWLATDPTSSGDGAYLIIGDLNSYAMEDPIDAIKAAGYTDLLQSLTNPYSYVFFGQAGYLDHALANSKMMAKVTGVTVWHINADEPSALDYNNYNQPELYNPDQYRASDHDPIIVGLDLNFKLILPLIFKNYAP